MSKYQPLWDYVRKAQRDSLTLTFGEMERVLGFAVDHSFLRYKKELTDYGYRVGKISMKAKTVVFEKERDGAA